MPTVISIHPSSRGVLTYSRPPSRPIVISSNKSRRLTLRHSSQQCPLYPCYRPSHCRACNNPIPVVRFLIDESDRLYYALFPGHPFPGATSPTENEHPLFSRLPGVYSRPRPGRLSATQPHRPPASHRWSEPTSPSTSPSFVTDRLVSICAQPPWLVIHSYRGQG